MKPEHQGPPCSECRVRDCTYVPGVGPPPGRALGVVVGEAPGRDEANQGAPFVGKSGQFLRAALQYLGVDPADVYMTNVVKCRPPGNQINKDEIGRCKSFLQEELKPYAQAGVPIALLGGVPSRVIIGQSFNSKMRGHWQKGKKVLPCWHPAFVLREPGVFWDFYFQVRKIFLPRRKLLQPEYQIFTSEDFCDAWDWFHEMEGTHFDRTMCFDLETEQADFYWNKDVLSMAVAYEYDRAIVLTEDFLYHEEGKKWLNSFFAASWHLVGHNVKFDLRYLHHALHTPHARANYDSLLGHYVLYEEAAHDLKTLASQYLDAPAYDNAIKRYINPNKENWRGVPYGELIHYNVLDVCYNLELWEEHLRPEMEAEGLFHEPFMFPIMASQPYLLRSELWGFPLDLDKAAEVSADLQEYADSLHERLEEMCGIEFNPRSPKQVSPIVYEHYNAPAVHGHRFKEGSTCDEARQKILQKIPEDSELATWLNLYGQYRSIVKVRSSYVEVLFRTAAPDNRVHCDMRVHGARTGRMSVRNPPLHSIPKPGHNRPGTPDWGLRIRGIFAAPSDDNWVIVMADYSQAEMRVVAAMSDDEWLLDAYNKGKDMHSEAAMFVYGTDFTKRHRQICKSVNFSQIYGGSPESAGAEADMDPQQIKHLSAMYHEMMPGLYAWRKEQFTRLRQMGYVATMTGRRRRAPLITRSNRRDMEKMAVNTPVQGSASELTLISFMRIWNWVDAAGMAMWVIPMLTVHDSVISQVHRDYLDVYAAAISQIMVATGREYFPQVPWKVDVEVGPAWGELREYEQRIGLIA